jgi:methylmalonyl-CoA mutase
LGLQGLIDDIMRRSDFDPVSHGTATIEDIEACRHTAVARAITMAEHAMEQPSAFPDDLRAALEHAASAHATPILGITGTGGAGKSSLTDELLRRWLLDHPEGRVAILSIDPTRKRSGGALLGDRIRMNAIEPDRVFMRSLATRGRKGELSEATPLALLAARAAAFDLIVVETSGIGQGDADIVDVVDVTLYVMTPEFGAPSQLEKIDMLDYADVVAINKFAKRGALDALRDVRKQVRRNRECWDIPDGELPVYGTVAARFADEGVTALYHGVMAKLGNDSAQPSRLPKPAQRYPSSAPALIDPRRQRYLADIADTLRNYHRRSKDQIAVARRRQRLQETLEEVADQPAAASILQSKLREAEDDLDPAHRTYLDGWPERVSRYTVDALVYQV